MKIVVARSDIIIYDGESVRLYRLLTSKIESRGMPKRLAADGVLYTSGSTHIRFVGFGVFIILQPTFIIR
jgi:hypothetical protein